MVLLRVMQCDPSQIFRQLHSLLLATRSHRALYRTQLPASRTLESALHIMVLKLVEVTNAEELPEFIDVYSSAFNGSHVNRAMLPGGRTPEYNEHTIRQNLKTMGRRNQWRIAVVDTTIDKIICVALWKLENDPTNAESKIPTEWFSKANVEAKEAFFGMIDDARQAVMGNKTYWRESLSNPCKA